MRPITWTCLAHHHHHHRLVGGSSVRSARKVDALALIEVDPPNRRPWMSRSNGRSKDFKLGESKHHPLAGRVGRVEWVERQGLSQSVVWWPGRLRSNG